ncbi:hypothetical protein [Aquimarina agarilytica]|uniref:hypothetical protein n=1 Tax=Aquimarina agarilytica TaxID=1087449 RepID=UPI0012FA0023|nr:hypothetical protein [Aquimarina agarilytica]
MPSTSYCTPKYFPKIASVGLYESELAPLINLAFVPFLSSATTQLNVALPSKLKKN